MCGENRHVYSEDNSKSLEYCGRRGGGGGEGGRITKESSEGRKKLTDRKL